MHEPEEPTIGDERASEVDESGRNLTQQRLDEEVEEGSAPVDAPWEREEPPVAEVDEDEAEEQGAW